MRIDFGNTTTSTLTITIEPWAEEHRLESGDRVSISFQGERIAVPLIEVSTTGLIVYGSPGSTVSVLRNGTECSGAGHIKAPDVPPASR